MNKWYNSPLVGMLGFALSMLIIVGGCSYTSGKCVESGGEWDGNSLSCDR